MYTELHARSAFSFLRGASRPEDLVAAACRHSLPALALLDRDGVCGAPDNCPECMRAEFKRERDALAKAG